MSTFNLECARGGSGVGIAFSSLRVQFNKPPEIYHSHSLQATFMPSLFRPFSSLRVLSKFAAFFDDSHSSLLLADRQCFKGLNHGIIFAI